MLSEWDAVKWAPRCARKVEFMTGSGVTDSQVETYRVAEQTRDTLSDYPASCASEKG
jgi:hypothetical protein